MGEPHWMTVVKRIKPPADGFGAMVRKPHVLPLPVGNYPAFNQPVFQELVGNIGPPQTNPQTT